VLIFLCIGKGFQNFLVVDEFLCLLGVGVVGTIKNAPKKYGERAQKFCKMYV